jgi:hypothetical protein
MCYIVYNRKSGSKQAKSRPNSLTGVTDGAPETYASRQKSSPVRYTVPAASGSMPKSLAGWKTVTACGGWYKSRMLLDARGGFATSR